jgi:hypothetical protein
MATCPTCPGGGGDPGGGGQATCASCPKPGEIGYRPDLQPYIDDPNHEWYYDNETGIVSNTPPVVVTGNRPSISHPDWEAGADALIGMFNPFKEKDPNDHTIYATVPDLPISPRGAARSTMILIKEGKNIVAKTPKQLPKLWKIFQQQLRRPKTTATVGKPFAGGALEETMSGVPNKTGPKSFWEKVKHVVATGSQLFGN